MGTEKDQSILFKIKDIGIGLFASGCLEIRRYENDRVTIRWEEDWGNEISSDFIIIDPDKPIVHSYYYEDNFTDKSRDRDISDTAITLRRVMGILSDNPGEIEAKRFIHGVLKGF